MDVSRKPSIASEMNARHERPHRLALLATSPVATGEAKQEEPRKGTEPMHRANQPHEKSSHISGCSFRIVLINVVFLFQRISSKRWHEASFFDWSYTLTPKFSFRKWYTIGRRGSLLRR